MLDQDASAQSEAQQPNVDGQQLDTEQSMGQQPDQMQQTDASQQPAYTQQPYQQQTYQQSQPGQAQQAAGTQQQPAGQQQVYTQQPYQQQQPQQPYQQQPGAYRQQPYQQQPQQPYQQQAFQPQSAPYAGAPPAAQPKIPAGSIVAIVCGALAIVASPTIALGIILGIIAIAFGVLGLFKSRRPLAIAGLSCGAVGLVASFAMLLAGWSLFGPFTLVRVSHDAPDTSAHVFTVKDSVAKRLKESSKGKNVADDKTLYLDIERCSMDKDGNLVIYCYMMSTGNADYLLLKDEGTWTVNDTVVDPELEMTLYKGDYERSTWFYIPADQIKNIGGLDAIYSIRGTLSCTSVKSTKNASPVTYQVAL